MELPQLVRSICEAVATAGGQAWLVGGVVRDHMMGIVSKDFDIEVHRLEAEDLAKVLRRIGSVNEIGRSFGVFKLVEDGVECDISIPRHDSQHGQAHNDIVVVGNPYMGIESAARRRDLTINAIALDPLTGKLEDPFAGARDIARGRLAAEDPKAVSARFGFSVHPDLAVLCREARLLSLPPERVWGELEKLLLRAPAPSMGWMLLHDLRIASQVLPDVADIPPEQVAAALDRAAERRSGVDGKGR